MLSVDKFHWLGELAVMKGGERSKTSGGMLTEISNS